jgi:hypothetical protein
LGILQAITALAHLRAAVLYVIDLSEQCGYSLEQQAALFHSLKPLFTNKPVVIVANKIDVTAFDSLSDEQRSLVEGMASEALRLRGYCVKGCWPLGGGSALHEHPSRSPSAVLLCAGEAPRYVWEASTV